MPAIPEPAFAGDDGGADPGLSAALALYASGGSRQVPMAALLAARVFVPVVAVADAVEPDEVGWLVDKQSAMAALLVRGRDERPALLAFTSAAALQAYSRTARPVPLATRDAARAALDAGAAALVVDIAGPVQLVVEGNELTHMAAGHRLVDAAGGPVWVVPVGRVGGEGPRRG